MHFNVSITQNGTIRASFFCYDDDELTAKMGLFAKLVKDLATSAQDGTVTLSIDLIDETEMLEMTGNNE